MKKLISFAILVISLNSYSQQFTKTDDFVIVGADRETVQKFNDKYDVDTTVQLHCHLTPKDDPTNHIATLWIEWPYLFDTAHVKVFEDPGLKNVERIVQVEMDYPSCCYDINIHYFMQLTDGTWMVLPQLHYVSCDWPQDIVEYVVDPSSSTINHANVHINMKGEREGYDVVESLFWDGKKLIAPH